LFEHQLLYIFAKSSAVSKLKPLFFRQKLNFSGRSQQPKMKKN